MGKKKMTKRNVLQLSLGSNKNPMNISLGGYDKSVEISFNSKSNKNIPIPISTITGRRIRQCCLYKYPKNEIMLTLPENVKLWAPNNGLPFVIEAQYLQNFKAAFYPLQLTDNDTESMEEIVPCSMTDYPKKIEHKKQYAAFKEYETPNKEKQKKNKLMMKHIHTLKRSLEQIGETLKEMEKCQTDTLSKENQSNQHRDRFSIKNKIKGFVKKDEITPPRNPDEFLMPSKSGKYTQEKILDHLMNRKQPKFEEKFRKKGNQMNNHSVIREDGFASAGKSVTESEDNRKSLELMLDNILKHNQIITDTPASQRKRKADAFPTDNKVLDDKTIKRQFKQAEKARKKENDNHIVREDDFASAWKTLADNMKSSNVMLDDIVQREKLMSEYKKKYIQDVEALYEDQQRLLEGSCNIFDISNRVSSEDCDLDQASAGRQQDCKNKNDKASEFRSDLPESGKEDTYRYESNNRPVITDIRKKPKLEEKLDNIIKEIQLLRFVNNIFEARKAKSDMIQKDRQTQEKTTKTSEVDIVIDKGTSTNTNSSVKEVTGIITHKYNILKGEQCEGNIYETTLTQTVKEFPSKTDKPKYAKLSKKEYLEALSDAKNAMRKLEATFEKIIPVLPKINQQPGVDPDAPITVSHHEENISGKIVKEQKIELSNGREKVAKDRPRHDVEAHISSKDGEIASRDQYIGVRRVQEERGRDKVAKDRIGRDKETHTSHKNAEPASKDHYISAERVQEDREQEQTKSGKLRLVVIPRTAVSGEDISSDQTGEKSNGVIPEEVESQSLQKGIDSSKSKISSRTGAIPKRPTFRSEEKLSSKGSMRFETLDGTVLKDKRDSVKSKNIPEQPQKTEELIISPAGVRRTDKRTYEKKYFIQDIDDIPQTFQTPHSSMKDFLKPTRIKHDQESAQRAQVSSDPNIFRRFLDDFNLVFFGRPGEEKMTYLPEKSTVTKSHSSDKTESDSVLSNLFKAPEESQQLPKQHAILKRDIITNKYNLEPLERNDRSYSRENDKLRSDQSELEFPKAEDHRKHKEGKKLIRSDAIEKETITSISPKVEDRRKLKEDKKLRSDVIEEGTITSISQYQLESPKAEDHRKHKEYEDGTSDSIIEGTITSISQYELESPTADDRRKLEEYMKSRSDAIEEGTITSISQYELESPKAEDHRKHKEYEDGTSDVIEEGTITSISQYELESPKAEDHLKHKEYEDGTSDSIIEGTITSISQYELESPTADDRRKLKEYMKSRSGAIKEGTITSISQYELESPKAEDHRNHKEYEDGTSDVIEEGTITSISQYELESPKAEDHRKHKEYMKSRSDAIEEGTITSISQYELESPTAEALRKHKKGKKVRSDVIEEGTITSISQYELESPKTEDPRKLKGYKKLIRSDAIEGGATSMSPKEEDHRKKEDNKIRSDVIDEGSITSTSQYELEYPKQDNHRNIFGFLSSTLLEDKKRRSDITEDRTIPSISQYELGKLQEPYRRSSGERIGRNSNEHSRSWYVPEYVEYSVSEPDTEVSDSIEDISKLEDAQRGRTSSKDKSRSWYVPEYVEYSVSEPDTEVFDPNEDISKLEDAQRCSTSSKDKSRSWYVPEYVEYSVSEPDTEVSDSNEDISKLEDAQRGRTSPKDKSRSWYVPEYVEYSVSEPDTEIFDPNEGISKLEDAQRGRTSSEDKSRSWYVPEYVEYSVSEPDTEEFNKTEEGYISDISQDRLNNSERGYNFLNKKSRNRYVPEKSVGSTLREPSNKEFDNFKERSMPDISNYEIERVRASDRNERKQNALDEMPYYRGLPHLKEPMNRSGMFLPNQEFSRKSYERTFRRQLPELQDYQEFGNLENAGSQSSRGIKKDIDRKDI